MGSCTPWTRATGEGLWRFETGGEVVSSPTPVALPLPGGGEGAFILVGSYDNRLYCLSAADGTQRWAVETEGYVHCTPAVLAGRTFIAGCDEHLRGIDLPTGEVTLDVAIGTYLIASPAAAGGRLHFGTYGGEVLAVDASTNATPADADEPKAAAVVWRAGGGAAVRL